MFTSLFNQFNKSIVNSNYIYRYVRKLDASMTARSDYILKKIFKLFMFCSDRCVKTIRYTSTMRNYNMTQRQNKEEPVAVEKCHPLCLACGDIIPDDVLHKQVKEDVINNTQLCDEKSYWGMGPLTIACSSGSISVARILKEANVAKYKDSPLIECECMTSSAYTQILHSMRVLALFGLTLCNVRTRRAE